MLRAAAPVSRRAALGLQRGQLQFARAYADAPKPSIQDSKPPVLPGGQSTLVSTPPVPTLASTTATTGTAKTIPGAGISLTPPSNAAQPTVASPPSLPHVSSAPVPPRKPKHRFRSFMLSLGLLSVLGYAGGVWYSTRSDNFHDFFTEYVPYGEDCVLYLEEREFRKRHPKLTNASSRPVSDGAKITIPSKSGLSWRDRTEPVGSDLETKGRHMSALEENDKALAKPAPKSPPPKAAPVKEAKPAAPTTAVAATDASKSSSADVKDAKREAAKKDTKSPASVGAIKSPEVNEPSVFLPMPRIDPMKVKDGDEPLVQELVKMLNDIILVVNEDNKTGKYTSSILKAKADVERVGQRIKDMKAQEHQSAQKEVQATQSQFDDAARDLVSRLEREMQDQESKWRDEFESERKKIESAYKERLETELERVKQVTDQKVRNQLLEQAIALKNDFASTVQSRVETERSGRLAKLDALSSSINELETLTAQWNDVLDGNLKTQHLQVAVEAVKSGLARADRPRPFIRELAALKELAAENAVVDSAIASINPASYQIGIPTSAQLIDRFRRVADEVRKAALLPEDAGIASHAASLVLSKVMFKKQGRTGGEDVESILTRTESLLEEGNLDDAAREMNTLQGWAKTLSRDWLDEARKVLEVKQALDVISAEARLQSLKVD